MLNVANISAGDKTLILNISEIATIFQKQSPPSIQKKIQWQKSYPYSTTKAVLVKPR
jgi:hypothetical protein